MKPNESTRTNDSNPGSLPSKLSKKTSSAIHHFFQCIRSFADVFHMTHALKNYSRVSTRLWNNFFWNNFQGIIFEGGRYTIMHVGI